MESAYKIIISQIQFTAGCSCVLLREEDICTKLHMRNPAPHFCHFPLKKTKSAYTAIAYPCVKGNIFSSF
jgi:hypothetical protein